MSKSKSTSHRCVPHRLHPYLWLHRRQPRRCRPHYCGGNIIIIQCQKSKCQRKTRSFDTAVKSASQTWRRRSSRLSTLAAVLAPPVDSDDSTDGEFDASESETEEARLPPLLCVGRQRRKRDTNRQPRVVYARFTSRRTSSAGWWNHHNDTQTTSRAPWWRSNGCFLFLLFYDQEVYTS